MSRPSVAFTLSLIGGIFVILMGLIIMAVGAVATFWIGGIGGVVGFFGVVCGVLMVVGAVMLYTNPEHHVAWGTAVIVFSFLSWIGAVGGLVIGFALGLVGGILGIIWRPPQDFKTLPPQAVTRYCPNCGWAVDPTAKYCPHCGKQLP
ncbi:MAG: DUF6114 domain-containing protein [Nitrososphaeria archaeon]